MSKLTDVQSFDTFLTWRERTNEIIANYADVHIAIIAPAITDDSDSDFAVGSKWLDEVAELEYTCFDATVGAAVWKNEVATATANSANRVLSNLTSASSARTNLSVYSKSESDSAIDDLSGVTDAAGARSNLSVYSASETNSAINISVDDLSGVTNPSGARTNLDVYNKKEVDDWNYSTVANGSTLQVNKRYLADRSLISSFHLPSSPSVGDNIEILVKINVATQGTMLMGRNGRSIMGLAEDMILDVSYKSLRLVWTGGNLADGWQIRF